MCIRLAKTEFHNSKQVHFIVWFTYLLLTLRWIFKDLKSFLSNSNTCWWDSNRWFWVRNLFKNQGKKNFNLPPKKKSGTLKICSLLRNYSVRIFFGFFQAHEKKSGAKRLSGRQGSRVVWSLLHPPWMQGESFFNLVRPWRRLISLFLINSKLWIKSEVNIKLALPQAAWLSIFKENQ